MIANSYTFADLQQARAMGFSAGQKRAFVLTIKVVASIVLLVGLCGAFWLALFI